MSDINTVRKVTKFAEVTQVAMQPQEDDDGCQRKRLENGQLPVAPDEQKPDR